MDDQTVKDSTVEALMKLSQDLINQVLKERVKQTGRGLTAAGVDELAKSVNAAITEELVSTTR